MENNMQTNSDLMLSEKEKIRQFILSNIDNIKEAGVYLLRPMSARQRMLFSLVAKEFPDILAFCIGEGEDRRIFLKYHLPFERLNLNEILRKGNRAFRRGDYEECIDTYRIVLDHCKPKVFVYAKLGLAHLKLDHKELAIDYLSIATELNNMGDYVLEYDYSNLVLKLQGKIEEADAKTFVSMTEKDFNRNLDECFGIKQIERIVRAISLGADPEVACREFGLNSEKTATALLVIARNCYVQGNQELGDLYMKKVERMKDKPSNVIYLFNSIRKNRKFYKNRSNESNKRFTLTPVLYDAAKK